MRKWCFEAKVVAPPTSPPGDGGDAASPPPVNQLNQLMRFVHVYPR